MTQPKARKGNVYPIPHPVTGEEIVLPSVTQLLKVLGSYTLDPWKQKQVAMAVASRVDLQLLASDEGTVQQAVDQALAFGNKANVGTAIHRFAELADAGTLNLDTIHPTARPYLEGYMKARERYGWTTLESEATVYNMTVGYAGTMDRLVDFPGYGPVIGDIKTGKAVYAEVALQLAFYANAEGFYDPDLGHRPFRDDVRADIAVVFHVTESGTEVYPVSLVDAFDAISGIVAVKRWQGRRGVVGKPLEATDDRRSPVGGGPVDVPMASAEDRTSGGPDAPTPVDGDNPVGGTVAAATVAVTGGRQVPLSAFRAWLVDRIRALGGNAEALGDLFMAWPEDVATLKASDAHTAEELQRIEGAVRNVEARARLPFVDPPWALTPRTEDEAMSAVMSAFGKVETSTVDTATADDIAPYVDRLDRLTTMHHKKVEEAANKAGIPNLYSPHGVTLTQLAALDKILKSYEAKTTGKAKATLNV